jgi:hypothetical protein
MRFRVAAMLVAVAFSFGLLGAPLAAGAQAVRRIPTVGYVGLPNEPSEPRWHDGFERGLRDHGYVPGHTIAVAVRTYTTR